MLSPPLPICRPAAYVFSEWAAIQAHDRVRGKTGRGDFEVGSMARVPAGEGNRAVKYSESNAVDELWIWIWPGSGDGARSTSLGLK